MDAFWDNTYDEASGTWVADVQPSTPVSGGINWDGALVTDVLKTGINALAAYGVADLKAQAQQNAYRYGYGYGNGIAYQGRNGGVSLNFLIMAGLLLYMLKD